MMHELREVRVYMLGVASVAALMSIARTIWLNFGSMLWTVADSLWSSFWS